MTTRATSLRNSIGRSNCAVAARAAPKSNAASPIVKPLASSARNTPLAPPARVGAQHPRLQRAGLVVDAASPKAVVLSVSTVTPRSLASRARLRAKALAPPSSRPSAIHRISLVGFCATNRCTAVRVAAQPGAKGFGSSARSFSALPAASSETISCRRAKSGPARRAARRGRPPPRCARAAAIRRSQLGAAGQPSSISRSNGPGPPPAEATAFQIGPAIARMIAAQMAIRSSSSGHGVRCGV